MARPALLAVVRSFDRFDAADDPHSEHNFSAVAIAVAVAGYLCFWKTDCYDLGPRFASPNPAVKTRVLAVMLVDEY